MLLNPWFCALNSCTSLTDTNPVNILRYIIIIIGVFWTQDAVILFVQIVDLGSEHFSEVEFNRLIFPKLIKFGFKSSDSRCYYYFLGQGVPRFHNSDCKTVSS